MAIYHANTKAISRGKGHSSTANAAYIGGKEITDLRTGEVFNYNRKGGVLENEIVLPSGIELPELTSQELWNRAEQSENRKDARVGREWEISLPHELTSEQRSELSKELTQNISDRYGVACEYAIHHPSREGSDERNYHVHILTTTRKIDINGNLGDKSDIEQDRKQCAQKNIPTSQEQIIEIREQIADTINKHLELANCQNRVNHLSLKDQGIDREPTTHKGKALCEQERRLERQVVKLENQIAHDGNELAQANAELAQLEIQKRDIERQREHEEQLRQQQELSRQQELLRTERLQREQREIAKLKVPAENYITAESRYKLFEIARQHKEFFSKQTTGGYEYWTSRNGDIAIHKTHVNVNKQSSENIKLALDVAVSQFGDRLIINGNADFVADTVEILARDPRYANISLINPKQQEILESKRLEVEIEGSPVFDLDDLDVSSAGLFDLNESLEKNNYKIDSGEYILINKSCTTGIEKVSVNSVDDVLNYFKENYPSSGMDEIIESGVVEGHNQYLELSKANPENLTSILSSILGVNISTGKPAETFMVLSNGVKVGFAEFDPSRDYEKNLGFRQHSSTLVHDSSR